MNINRLIFIAIGFYSLPLCADPYPFGRLFTTPEERKVLDEWRRNGNAPVENIAPSSVVKATQPSTLKKIELSGYLLREDGSSIVWINGKSELSATQDTVKTSKPNSGTLSVYHEGKRMRLKPGQAWMVDENQVKESYEIVVPVTSLTPNGEQSKDTDDDVKLQSTKTDD